MWNSSVGPIQIGIPPETLKTSVNLGKTVPQIFVLPEQLLFGDNNLAETEFPIYWNYFVKGAFKNPENKSVLIGSVDQLERMKVLFKESLYGPDEIFVNEEIDPIRKQEGYHIKLKEEMLSFAIKGFYFFPCFFLTFTGLFDFFLLIFLDILVKGEFASVDEFCTFLPLINGSTTFEKEDQNKTKVKISIETKEGAFFQFYENDAHKASLHFDLPSRFPQKELPPILSNPSLFDPPTFGVTFLGTSHGFDPKGNTTGFIVWINGRGILVDPPVQTTGYLRENRIPTGVVKDVILTHCHSDHDGGVLKKILDGEKITLYTTKTVHGSYQNKIKAVVGRSLSDFYEFVPVPIGRKIEILGALCEFDYSFHSKFLKSLQAA